MSRVAEARARAQVLRARFEGTAFGGLVLLFRSIQGRDRVLMLAGHGFIALIPLLIVVATVLSSGGEALGTRIIARFGLTGSSADAVALLFGEPPQGSSGTTLVSYVVLLWSVTSFARSLQRMYEDAWGMSRRGMRGSGWSALGFVVIAGSPALGGWVTHQVGGGPLLTTFAVVLQLLVGAACWALATRLLVSLRVSWWAVAEGALATSVVQVLIGWGSAIYIPRIMALNSERYGVIGVAMALVSWLIVVAAGLVFGAVAGPVLSGRLSGRTGNRPQEVPT